MLLHKFWRDVSFRNLREVDAINSRGCRERERVREKSLRTCGPLSALKKRGKDRETEREGGSAWIIPH